MNSYHSGVARHVNGPIGFPDTGEPFIKYGPNTSTDSIKPGENNPFVVLSDRQFTRMFHEPGWDLPYEEDSTHAFEMPNKAAFGHTVAGMSA